MPVAQAKAVVHRRAQGDRIKVGMLPDHLQIILHGAGLPDGVVDRKHPSGKKLFRVELVEVVQLSLFVGIHENEIERTLDLCHLSCVRRP